MTGPEPGSPGSSGAPAAVRRSPRLQTWLFLAALFAVAAITAGGYLYAEHRAEEQSEQDAEDAADAAATSAELVVDRVTNALASASALARRDASLDTQAFPAFAASLDRIGAGEGAAMLGVVEPDDRAAFEALYGLTISVPGSGGELVRAPDADVHYPMVLLAGRPDGDALVGFDYASDDVRREAADEAVRTGMPVMTRPVPLADTGEEAVVVVQPIVADAAGTSPRTVGLVATPLPVADLAAAVTPTVPAGSHVAIADGDDPVFDVGEPTGGRTTEREVELAGRTWQLTVDPPPSDGPSVGMLVLVAGVLFWLALLVLFAVTVRYQRRLGEVNRSLADAEARASTLERLASRLARALSSEEVGDVLLDGTHALTGASSGAVVLRSSSGDQLELVAASGYDEAHRARLARVPLPSAPILSRALAGGGAEYLPSPLAWRSDESLARFVESGMAAAVIPLVAGEEVPGLLVVCQPAVRTFDAEERSLLESIGAMAGRALVRSLRYDAEHAASVAFQRASLPAVLPEVEGVSAAARYRPATSTSAVGGDWYDVVPLGDGRVAVVVGDVVGHGVTAAAAMGHLRSGVRVLASALPEPADLLPAITAEVASLPDAFGATMAYGVVDPATGTFRHVLAGHLPPLVLRRAGGAELVPTPPWPPLGIDPGEPPDVAVVHLEPGDTVLLYTDGVVERRGESLDVGLERLRDAAAGLVGHDPDQLCDALLAALVPGDDQPDDIAVVALQLVGTGAAVLDLTGTPTPDRVDQGVPPTPR
jgi:CHASE1-domain containing sensor protein